MRWLAAALATLEGALAVTSCTSFGTSASDRPETPAVDASASPDASLADGGTSPEAGCPPSAFCDDFERTRPTVGSWDSIVDSRSRLTIDDALAHSPSRSLNAHFDGPDPGYLRKNLSTGSKRVRVRFAIFFDSYPGDALTVLALELGSGNSLHFRVRKADVELFEQIPESDSKSHPYGTIEAGKWHLVQLTYDAATSQPTIELRVDEDKLDQRAAELPLGDPQQVTIGTVVGRPGVTHDIRIDDVVIE